MQCAKAAKKAMRMQGIVVMVHRQLKNMEKQHYIYRNFVRPHLEYTSQVWSPYKKLDVECLEKVQRRATKLVIGLKNRRYEDQGWKNLVFNFKALDFSSMKTHMSPNTKV